MKDSKSERRACNAVVKCLEELTGEVGSERRCPDREKGGDGRVDMTVKLGEEPYAIEHTRLEAFDGEIKARKVILEEVIKALKERIVGQIPGPSYYSVGFAADCRLPGGKKEKEWALSYIVEWVRKAIETLHERKWCRQGLREQPHIGADWIDMFDKSGEFYWVMGVVRWPYAELAGEKPGSLILNPLYKPGRLSEWVEKGCDRVRRAFEKKRAKLKKCKESGARTILVFESENVREDLGSGEVRLLARQHRDVLDEVYLLEDGQFGWCVVTVKRGDKYHEKELGSLSWFPYEIGSVKKEDLSERSGLPKCYIKALGEEFFEQEYPSYWDGWRPAIVSENDVCE